MSYSILRLPEVIKKTSISRSTIYERVKNNTFPQPISLGERSIGFVEAEIDSWIESKIAESRNISIGEIQEASS